MRGPSDLLRERGVLGTGSVSAKTAAGPGVTPSYMGEHQGF